MQNFSIQLINKYVGFFWFQTSYILLYIMLYNYCTQIMYKSCYLSFNLINKNTVFSFYMTSVTCQLFSILFFNISTLFFGYYNLMHIDFFHACLLAVHFFFSSGWKNMTLQKFFCRILLQSDLWFLESESNFLVGFSTFHLQFENNNSARSCPIFVPSRHNYFIQFFNIRCARVLFIYLWNSFASIRLFSLWAFMFPSLSILGERSQFLIA